MATRVIKLRRSGNEPAPDDTEQAPATSELHSQRKRPELGRFLLQVDRQTKGSYATVEAAEALGRTIKTQYPVVQVSIYDTVECQSTAIS